MNCRKWLILFLLGTGTSGFSGDGGSATNAMVNRPERVTADTLGTLFIGDGSKPDSLLSFFSNLIFFAFR